MSVLLRISQGVSGWEEQAMDNSDIPPFNQKIIYLFYF